MIVGTYCYWVIILNLLYILIKTSSTHRAVGLVTPRFSLIYHLLKVWKRSIFKQTYKQLLLIHTTNIVKFKLPLNFEITKQLLIIFVSNNFTVVYVGNMHV